MHLAKGNKPTRPFVPKSHAHALEALTERKPPDGSKLWVIPQHSWQSVIWDTAAEMVDMVRPDIGGEPAQDARQVIVGAAVQRRLVKIPALVTGPEGILELVLNVEQPDANRTCEKRDRRLGERYSCPDPH